MGREKGFEEDQKRKLEKTNNYCKNGKNSGKKKLQG